MRIYTIGHSTRSLEDFIDILKNFDIELVIDIRRFPSSKKFPHFNRENLEKGLEKEKIRYVHFPELGGYREEGYLAFTQTEEFSNSIKKLLEIIDDKNSAIMCAEWNVMRCHRKYVSDHLHKLNYEIIHIVDKNKTEKHQELPAIHLKIFCDRKAKN